MAKKDDPDRDKMLSAVCWHVYDHCADKGLSISEVMTVFASLLYYMSTHTDIDPLDMTDIIRRKIQYHVDQMALTTTKN